MCKLRRITRKLVNYQQLIMHCNNAYLLTCCQNIANTAKFQFLSRRKENKSDEFLLWTSFKCKTFHQRIKLREMCIVKIRNWNNCVSKCQYLFIFIVLMQVGNILVVSGTQEVEILMTFKYDCHQTHQRAV